MKRLIFSLSLVVATAACTPAEVAHWASFARPVAGLPCGQWVGTSRVAGFTDGELANLHRIMRRESGCTPTAEGPTDDWGLMQVIGAHLPVLCRAGIACSRSDLLEPQTNLRAARFLYERDGWAPWAVHHGGG